MQSHQIRQRFRSTHSVGMVVDQHALREAIRRATESENLGKLLSRLEEYLFSAQL
jgi:hypothetical protein